MTPLHWAVYKGQADAARVLLDRDADIEAKDNLVRVSLACGRGWGNGKRSVVQSPFKSFETHDRFRSGHSHRHFVMNTQCGWTPLMWAAYRRHCQLVVLLADYGANVNVTDQVRGCPEHWSSKLLSDKLRRDAFGENLYIIFFLRTLWIFESISFVRIHCHSCRMINCSSVGKFFLRWMVVEPYAAWDLPIVLDMRSV